VEALLPRFREANTQVLGVSVDSVYSHANWARDLGGISFPLLSDFEPKGAMARSYGLYLDGPGITDRATVVIDSAGVVRHTSSVGPGGKRDIGELAELCARIDREAGTPVTPFPAAPGVPKGAVLYVKSQCGFSRAVLLARDNLHLAASLPVRNVTEDEAARAECVRAAGKDQAPCLVVGGAAKLESADIIAFLCEAAGGRSA
jgi:hypothetical protein